MKKDTIFFSADGNGLTATSANHIANLAKEMVREVESSLANLKLYSTSVSLIGTETSNTLGEGNTKADLDEVPSKLMTVAKANSLIAWLREAIKAKERMLNEVRALSLPAYMKLKGIEYTSAPEMQHSLTEDEYYASLSIEERNRYYHLEALASVLGKAVHPDGSLADAREKLNQRLRNPRQVEGDGRDALIYAYTPTVESREVDEVYFKIQKQFREVQAQLNAMKFDCQKAINESQIAARAAMVEATEAHNARMAKLAAEFNAYEQSEMRRIGDLKIVIPDSLRDIYEEVAHLGKK